MRFERPDGKYAEVASNQAGPEQIPVPPGYRFVSSTPMVPAVVTDEMVERVVAWDEDGAFESAGPSEWWREALSVAFSTKETTDG